MLSLVGMRGFGRACVALAAGCILIIPALTHPGTSPEGMPVARPGLGHAIVVARDGNCASRLAFLRVFDRPPGNIALEGLFVSARNDAALTPFGSITSAPIRRATSLHGEILRASRLRAPAFVIYDGSRVVRVVIQAPATAEGAEDLVRWLIAH